MSIHGNNIIHNNSMTVPLNHWVSYFPIWLSVFKGLSIPMDRLLRLIADNSSEPLFSINNGVKDINNQEVKQNLETCPNPPEQDYSLATKLFTNSTKWASINIISFSVARE